MLDWPERRRDRFRILEKVFDWFDDRRVFIREKVFKPLILVAGAIEGVYRF